MTPSGSVPWLDALDSLDGFEYGEQAVAPRDPRTCSLEELVGTHVRPGDVVHYPWLSTRATGALFEVLRRSRRRELHGLTIVSTSIRGEVGLVAASGGFDRIVTSFAASSHPAIRANPLFRRSLATGSIELEEWSLLAIVQRTLAGALGWPFVPALTMDGTDLPVTARDGVGVAPVANPFGGDDVSMMPPLNPDVCLIHCPVADWHGNGVLFPPFAEDVHGAYAARRGVILTAERIVSPRALRSWAAFVKVPAARVLGVAEVPFGAHPSAVPLPFAIDSIAGYGEDYDFHNELGRLASSEEADAFFARWIDVSRSQYLRRLGRSRLEHVLAKGLDESWQLDGLSGDATPSAHAEPTIGERIAVAGAHALVSLADRCDAGTVIAGAGVSSLAAGLARAKLLRAGTVVDLVFESGVVGYVPRPFDSMLSNTRNLPTAGQLSSTLDVLGMLIARGDDSVIAMLAAGVIDHSGNANSNRLGSGAFLVGGGGSTDIVRRVKSVVVVPASRRRFASDVDFVTYGGANVAAIATDVAVVERQGDRYVMTAWFSDCAPSVDAAIRVFAERTGWSVEAAESAAPIAPPSVEELVYLRSVDPQGNLLR